MKSWKSIVLGFIALVLIGNWISRRIEQNAPVPSPAPQITSPETITPSAGTPPLATPPTPENPPPPAAAPGPAAPQPVAEAPRASTLRDLEDPLVVSYPPSTPPPRPAADAEPDVAADFDKISLMLRDYRTLTGENPVGTNAEIIKALNGGNPKGAQLGPSDGQGLNEKGELIDRWGTPYFFHQLTKDLMEIHSAGPDRRRGTGDDIVGR